MKEVCNHYTCDFCTSTATVAAHAAGPITGYPANWLRVAVTISDNEIIKDLCYKCKASVERALGKKG